MTKITAVLFDLDGTLIDTAPDFIRILKHMGSQKNWQIPADELIREQVSAGAAAMVKLMLDHNDNKFNADELTQYRQQFLDTYEADICVDSQIFAGLNATLQHLEQQGIPWGIVTNKPRYLAEILLDKLQLTERCQVLVCPDDVSQTKPDPEPMYLAMEQLALEKNVAGSVIYVGDHIRDIQAGNAAGMITVLAGYGYIPPEDQQDLQSWQANYVVDTSANLSRLLLSLVS